MKQGERRAYLIRALMAERPDCRGMGVPVHEEDQKRLLRALMNIREAVPASPQVLGVQDDTQGDYGLWQCSKPCHRQTYDNEAAVRRMIARQQNMRIPTELVPHCPRCGRPMAMNLRSDEMFVHESMLT